MSRSQRQPLGNGYRIPDVSCRRGNHQAVLPLLPRHHAHAEVIVVDPHETVLIDQHSLRNNRQHLLRDHTDINDVAPKIPEAIERQAVGKSPDA
jgi:hypothetical protein